ncbi:unnamed protein product [Owenia fusiformis]|uniref:Uncharacterized protein n=1 Tax=Owenia fusiformis TaxID=6347 RepID=A0A8J1TMQ4_OWEFU|nr:unnamed protein product [Owenia fusiformis]
MWKVFAAVLLLAYGATYAQNNVEWCECALFREDGFLENIEPNLQNLTGGYVNLGSRLECNNGDLTMCDQYCRQQIKGEINGNYTFYTLVRDGTEHSNETYGDHMCERVADNDPTEMPIGFPGYPVFAFSRMAGCITLDPTWYTFADSQFDPPNNLCCNADATYAPCN